MSGAAEAEPSEVDRRNLRAALDRLVPAVDGLPAAGAMGTLPEIERMAAAHGRFAPVLVWFTAQLSLAGAGAFAELAGDAQDSAIGEIEAAVPGDFALLLELVYLAYYGRAEVHARIGWRTGPLQPAGFELPPFDESVLDTVRQRVPFWRQT